MTAFEKYIQKAINNIQKKYPKGTRRAANVVRCIVTLIVATVIITALDVALFIANGGRG